MSVRFSSRLAAGAAALLAATGLLIADDLNCFKDNPGPACDHYVDATPSCPDVVVGGGQCGNPAPAASGQKGTAPSGATCTVIMKVKASDGSCVSIGPTPVTVGCSQAAGDACGTASSGGGGGET